MPVVESGEWIGLLDKLKPLFALTSQMDFGGEFSLRCLQLLLGLRQTRLEQAASPEALDRDCGKVRQRLKLSDEIWCGAVLRCPSRLR